MRPAIDARGPYRPTTVGRVDERLLAERLITYQTATVDGLRAASGFVKGWLEARDIRVRDYAHNGLPVVLGGAGAAPDSGAPTGVRPDRRRARARPPGPRRRRAGPRRAVRAARRGRPPLRPRRLRHEGRARGDD